MKSKYKRNKSELLFSNFNAYTKNKTHATCTLILYNLYITLINESNLRYINQNSLFFIFKIFL